MENIYICAEEFLTYAQEKIQSKFPHKTFKHIKSKSIGDALKNFASLFKARPNTLLIFEEYTRGRNITNFIYSLVPAKEKYLFKKGKWHKITLIQNLSYSLILIIDIILSLLSIIGYAITLLFLKLIPNNTSYPKRNSKDILFIRCEPIYGEITGGSFSHVKGFVEGVTQNGYSPTLLFSHPIDKTITSYIVPLPKVPTISTLAVCFYYNWMFIYEGLKISKNKKWLFIYHRYSSFSFCGVILAKLLKTPLFLEFNSSVVWKMKYWQNQKKGLSFVIAKIVENICLEKADKIFVVSTPLKEALIESGISKDKIFVNPNGVNVEKFMPNCGGDEIREKLNLKDKVVATFVGTFGKWHGIPTLKESIKKVLDKNIPIHFLLIGEGELKNDIEQALSHPPYKERVTFLGKIPHQEIPQYLDASDILLSPQGKQADGKVFFGSPIKLFEYMAMGKSIVASGTGQIKEVIKDGKNGLLIEPDNADDLTQKIITLAENKTLREKLGKQAREDAQKYHTWKKNALNVIEKALKTN